jgi:hypothetical protein
MAPIIPQFDRKPWPDAQGNGMDTPSVPHRNLSRSLFAAYQTLLTGGSDLLRSLFGTGSRGPLGAGRSCPFERLEPI